MPAARVLLLIASALLILPASTGLAQSVDEGQRIFQEKCAACHRIGGGTLVGPDLQGVTSRRDPGWLRRQITDPLGLIQSGDPTAVQLVKDMNGMQMVPLGLSDSQVESVIAYLASTAQQQQVAKGVPRQYLPTVSIGVVLALALTALALALGKKRVDVR